MICCTLLGSAIKRHPSFIWSLLFLFSSQPSSMWTNFIFTASSPHQSLTTTTFWSFGYMPQSMFLCSVFYFYFRFLFILLNSCYSWLRSICEKDEIILMKTEAYIWMPCFKAWTFASSSLRQSSSRIPTLPSQMQIFARKSESECIRMSSWETATCGDRKLFSASRRCFSSFRSLTALIPRALNEGTLF